MEQPETLEFGSRRVPLRDRWSPTLRGRLAVLVAFVVGVVTGSTVLGAVSAHTTDVPELSTSVVRVASPSPFSENVAIDVRVHNDSPEQVQVDRVSAEMSGFSLVRAALRAPDGGSPLRIEAGESEHVDLTVRRDCMSGGLGQRTEVTLLVVLGAGGGAGQTVALPATQLDDQLRTRWRSTCEVSHRARDYRVQLRDARTPGWAGGRLLVLDVRLRARGPLASGLRLAEVREHFAGVRGHFHRTHASESDGTLDWRGINGELWLRLTDCDRARSVRGRTWPLGPEAGGLTLFVEKPASGSAVPVRRNPAVASRVEDWVESACADAR